MKRALVAAAFLGAMTASAMAIELPPDIAKRGSLKVALVPNYPPMEFRDPATNALSGFDIDLGEAIGRKLGVKIEWQETSFAEFMPSISTGRVDAILSGFTDYASRHDIASFVDYLRSGPQFFVQQSRKAEFKDAVFAFDVFEHVELPIAHRMNSGCWPAVRPGTTKLLLRSSGSRFSQILR